jgi:hypothetical protein
MCFTCTPVVRSFSTTAFHLFVSVLELVMHGYFVTYKPPQLAQRKIEKAKASFHDNITHSYAH